MRTLVIAFTIAALRWYGEAETPLGDGRNRTPRGVSRRHCDASAANPAKAQAKQTAPENSFATFAAQRLFENERVIVWRLTAGERAEPLVRDRHVPGVIVTLGDGAVRIVDDVNTVTARDVAPASAVVLIAIKDHPRGRLETPLDLPPAFPRDGARRVVENDRVTVWQVTWTKGLKTPRHFHDKDVVAVYLDPGTVRSIALSGETAATPRLAGDTVFIPGGRAHIEECIDGPRRDVIIELK